jgi:predicted LPLAT superfamily acyltransferase
MSSAVTRVGWKEVSERGGAYGLLFMATLATLVGRGGVRAFVRLVALWFTLFDRTIHRVSRAYLERMGLPSGFGAVLHHVLTFAEVAVDRLFFAKNELHAFVFTRVGHEHIEALAKSGKGALLLGAHVGSFDAMRAHADEYGLRVSALVDFRNARRMQQALKRFAPEAEANLLAMEGDPLDTMLEVRERIARGECVALLADRVGPGDRTVTVPFLGDDALLPAGPFLLAAALKCPVYLSMALYSAPNRYELHCEPLWAADEAPRARDPESLARAARAYAARVEHHVRRRPDNWFNFFDFWREP